ncbi:MAG: LEA type 2 family protein [Casimicrobiaceae bacterium]
MAWVACLATVLLVAACATTRLEAPKLTVNGVRLDRMTAADTQFTVIVSLVNPNEREIAVDTIDADLRIEDVGVGAAHLAAPVRLLPRGETTASLVAHTSLSAALRAAAEIARRSETQPGGASSVRYSVSGMATLKGGGTIPFSRSGEFAWSRNGAPPQ